MHQNAAGNVFAPRPNYRVAGNPTPMSVSTRNTNVHCLNAVDVNTNNSFSDEQTEYYGDEVNFRQTAEQANVT